MLISSVFLLLSSNAVSDRRDKSVLYGRSVITILVSCFILGLTSLYMNFLDRGLGLYHGLFHSNAITHVFSMFIYFICALILQLNSFYPRKIWTEKFSSLYMLMFCKLVYFNSFILNKMAEQFRILEYPLIILFVIAGGVFLISCSDLMSIFLAIELQSYGLYLLCGVYRDSEKATSASLTYFLLGGLSSCFILLASALLYGNSGNTGFDSLYVVNNISSAVDSTKNTIETFMNSAYESKYFNYSLIIMSVGFLFKVTAAPFHFWSPDVYDAIPTIVTTFVAIFAKISIFILLLELVHFTTNLYVTQNNVQQDTSMLNYSWTFTLLVSSLLSLIIGSVLGLTQFRIKRLYAYSTISHVGFILLALTINSIESIQSFMFYLVQYSVTNLNAFLILITVGYSLYLYVEKSEDSDSNIPVNTISDKKNSPLQLISQMKGYFDVNPMLALSLGLTIFSLVGVPPLIGFFAKQMILSSALDSGYIFMSLIAILASVISACYYLALIKQIFFDKSDYILNSQLNDLSIKCNIVNRSSDTVLTSLSVNSNNVSLSSSLAATTSILTLIILFFILNPQECLSITNILSLILFNC